jgi:putative peptide zinc metalloprotease protein
MPTDRALLAVTRGQVTAVVDGTTLDLRGGDEVYVRDGDRVSVADRSSAHLTFRGGSLAVLCADTELGVGELVSDPGRPIQPYGQLALTAGRILADTQTASTAFRPLRLTVAATAGETASAGAARFRVDPGASELSTGDATFNGTAMAASRALLTCGDGVTLPVVRNFGSSGSTSESTSESPSPSPGESPSPSDSASASTDPTPTTAGPTTGSPTPTRTRTPSPGVTTVVPTTSPPPPPDTTPPIITNVASSSPWIDPEGCQFGTTTVISAAVSDPDDTISQLRVYFHYVFSGGKPAGNVGMSFEPRTGRFRGVLGPFAPISRSNLTITVTVVAADDNGNVAQAKPISVTFYAVCAPG